jgi:hypothetical protein
MSAKLTAAAILIQASPQAVWDVLTDGSQYTAWNSTIVEFDGDIEPKGKIKLVSTVDPSRSFKLKVTEWEPPSRMVWSAGNFIFKGRRTYTVTPKGEGTVEFRMEERFTGLFSGPISKSIPDLQPSFDQFAADLKTAAEAR